MSFLSLELKIELTSLPSTGQRPHFKKRDLLSGVNNQLFVRVLILMTFAYTAVVFVVAFRLQFLASSPPPLETSGTFAIFATVNQCQKKRAPSSPVMD